MITPEHASQKAQPSPFLAVIPNLLTLTRLGLGLMFPLLPRRWWLGAFAAAVVTEYLDGTLSRLWHVTSLIGQVLDPIADKIFLIGSFGTLIAAGTLNVPQAAFVAARDLLVLLGCIAVVLIHGPSGLKRMPPRPLGKLATGGQLLFLFLLLVSPRTAPWALWPVGLMSLAAGIDYLMHYR